MKKLSLLLGALVIMVAGLVYAPTKQVSANQSWPSEVLVSSAQVRFEAQATGYDEATNKYKYKFSWLMPKGKTYSFKIDGNMYQSKVTQNAVIETPFWFSPDITYTIQIYPYANGKGAMLAQGTFKAPAKPSSTLTEEQEYELLFQYLNALPEYKSKNIKSKTESESIYNLLFAGSGSSKYAEYKQYLSKASVMVFDQLPILVEGMDSSQDNTADLTKYTPLNIKIVQGKQYGYIRQTLRNKQTKETYHPDMVFIKEEGQWKIDYLQTFKSVFEELGYLN